jgi:FMN phosphatase YigB (HAD superfamily)
VGDTYTDDIKGCRQLGIKGVLLRRPDRLGMTTRVARSMPEDCPIISSLTQLVPLLMSK